MIAAGRVAVLGSVNMDLVTLQPRLPEPGETIFGMEFSTGPGGKGLNQAVAAARAGCQVDMIAAVGSDEFGAKLIERLADDGINIDRIQRVDGPSGIAQISLVSGGENSIVVVPGANLAAAFSDEDRRVIDGCSHLMVQLERPRDLVREAMAYARSVGVTTVLTPAPVTAGLNDLLELADIVVANAGEAAELTGEIEPEAALLTLSRYTGTAVVTLGARGSIVASTGSPSRSVRAPKTAPVDTTAAGDTFTGFLTAQLAQGQELDEALRVATAAAAITVTRRGAADSIPTLADLDG